MMLLNVIIMIMLDILRRTSLEQLYMFYLIPIIRITGNSLIIVEYVAKKSLNCTFTIYMYIFFVNFASKLREHAL